MPGGGYAIVVAVLVATFAWGVGKAVHGVKWVGHKVGAGVHRVVHPHDHPPAAQYRPLVVRVLERHDGFAPIATWTEDDKTLRVTNQLAADALLCIRRGGAEECKLTAEWLGQ
jgi:hypothetical protein